MANKQTPGANSDSAERKPYNLANAKADGKTAMVEATPIMGYNGDIISLTDVMKIGDAFEATLTAIETRGLDQDGKDRVVYVFRDKKGEEFGVWGRGGLNLLNRVPLGSLTRVTYSAYDEKAIRPVPKHQFKIELEQGVRLVAPELGFIPPGKRANGAAHSHAN